MNDIRNIVITVLAALLLAAIIFGIYQSSKREDAESLASKNQKVVNQAATIIDRYIDTSRRKHVVIAADSNKLQPDWYKNGTAIKGGLVDTVASALQIAKKQLQAALQIASTKEAEKLKAVKMYDSLQRLTYYYKDKYLQLAYRPARVGDTTDNGEFDFKYNDEITVAQYWKKKWFLGAKKSYIDIFSSDPRTTINGVKRLSVIQEEPAFGLRVQAVSNYNFSRGMINIGPGIQFDAKRFSLVGTAYYDFDAKIFRPAIGARFDVARF